MSEAPNLNISYEELLQRMLTTVSDIYDKRETSLIYTSLAPTAVELQTVYILLKYILDEFFSETSSRENLIRRASERKIFPHQAKKARWKGLFNIDIPLGSRFSLEHLDFIAVERLATGEYVLECETAGEQGNLLSGQLIPIEYINGLETAYLSELLIHGEDEEETESFRQRFLETMRLPATSGNKADYKIWAKTVNSVGDAKVFPVWSGPGTVKVVVINTDKLAVGQELINEVANYIEEMRPIGAKVTVVSAAEKPITVSANVDLSNGYNISQIQNAFQQALIQHFADIAFSRSYVSYAQIGNLLLSIPGVGDYSNFLLNGTSANVLLNDEEVPVVGSVVLEV